MSRARLLLEMDDLRRMDSCEVNRGLRKLAEENFHTEKPEESKISAELLQNLSFELIATSEELWRTYSENKDGED